MLRLSRTSMLLLRHSLVAWPAVRMIFALALLMTLNPPLPVGGVVSLGVIALSVAVAMLAMWRRRERLLLANLGVDVAQQVLLLALPALLLELLLGMLLGLIAGDASAVLSA